MLNLKKTIMFILFVMILVTLGIISYLTGKMHGRYEGQEEVIQAEWKRINKTDSLLRKQTETCMKLFDKLYLE